LREITGIVADRDLSGEGARFVDRALIAYGRAFEHPCKIRFVRWLIHSLASGRVKIRHAGGAVIAIDPQDYIGLAIFRTSTGDGPLLEENAWARDQTP
jgi:hypothetical protein